MKELKKCCILSILVCVLLIAGVLTACAAKNDDANQNLNEMGTEQTANETDDAGSVAKVDMKNEWKDMTAPEDNYEEAEPRNLSNEELAEFTRFVTEDDRYGNYGFLLSVYDSPEKIDLNEVFYTGAGIETEPLSEEEKQAFLEAAESEEIYTDVVRLTTDQINEVLQKRTGLTYEQMASPLQWTYLQEYDAYYHEAGDTNYMAYTCIGGTTEDEKYFKLRFRQSESLMEGAYHQIDMETVLEKAEEGYRFVSNRLMMEEGLIEDQTFQTNVSEFGEVTIAAYEPDTEKDAFSDVTFVMLKDGRILSYLQGMEQGNIRHSAFQKVECVSFPDYNRDGYTDMIAICSYLSPGDVEYKEVRIYSGNEWGYLSLEEELSVNTNSALAELSIESVLEFLGYDR